MHLRDEVAFKERIDESAGGLRQKTFRWQQQQKTGRQPRDRTWTIVNALEQMEKREAHHGSNGKIGKGTGAEDFFLLEILRRVKPKEDRDQSTNRRHFSRLPSSVTRSSR